MDYAPRTYPSQASDTAASVEVHIQSNSGLDRDGRSFPEFGIAISEDGEAATSWSGTVTLMDIRMHDGSRLFGCLPMSVLW